MTNMGLGFPDDDDEEEEESVEALLARFRKEDAEPGAALAAALLQTARIENEFANAKVAQAIRAEWTAKAEARACLELRDRRKRLRCELEKLQVDELRAEVSELRERLGEQLKLVASLQMELDLMSQTVNAAFASGTNERLRKNKTSVTDASQQNEPAVAKCIAEAALTKAPPPQKKKGDGYSLKTDGAADLLADIRQTLLTASGSAAAEMLERALRRLGAEQYGRRCHFLEELLQNADDCLFPDATRPRVHVHALWEKGALQSLTLLHNEEGLTEHDVRSLCDVGHSTKVSGLLKQTGHKGVGFKSTFLVTDRPLLFSRSGHFSFAFDRNSHHGYLGIVLPVDVEPSHARSLLPPWVPSNALNEGTMLHLPLLSDITHLELQPALEPPPHILLFLRRLKELRIYCGDERAHIPSREWRLLRCDDHRLKDGQDKIFKRTVERCICENGSENHCQLFSWVIYRHEFRDRHGCDRNVEIAFAHVGGMHENGDGTSATTEFGGFSAGPDVFCVLPVQRVGLPFLINAEDLELTTSRSEVREDSLLNIEIRKEILTGVLAAVSSHEEIREPLIHALRPRLCSSNGRSDQAHGASAHHAGFFEALLQNLVLCLRQMPCLLSESGEWCCPGDLRLRPQDCAMDLLGNTSLRRSVGKQFAANSFGKEEELGHLGVCRLAPTELIELIRDVLQNEETKPSEWMQRLYVFLLQIQHELAESGALGALRELKGLVRVKELGHDHIQMETLARQQTSSQVFLGVSVDACWPTPDLQIQELSDSGMIKCVCSDDFAQPEARRFLELHGLKEASLEDISDAFAYAHWRGEFASARQCWAGLRYLCRIWPRLQKMQRSASQLKSALCCPCEDGGLRPMSEVHVRSFLGEACSDCTEPSSEVCGQLPPRLDSDLVTPGLEVANTFHSRELQCRATASEDTTWLGVRGTCGVLSGCWRYDVHIDRLPRRTLCSIAIGWGTVDVPLRSNASEECAAARTILTGSLGWVARAKEIKWNPSRTFGEKWNVVCLLDASAYTFRFDAFNESGIGWTSEWLPIPRSMRGAELWPLIRLRHGASVHVSFTGPRIHPTIAMLAVDDKYKALAQACNRARTSTSRSVDSYLAGSPVEKEQSRCDDVRQPAALQWEAFLLSLGVSPHWKGCTHRHRWVAAMEKPLEGDCPLCLMPLSSPVISSTAGEETGAVGLPCEHKFHSACVRDLAVHDSQQQNRQQLKCPVCRAAFRPEEQVRLSGSLSRRASCLCAPLQEILAPDADASLQDMLRVYAFSDSVGLLRRVSAHTSCGVRTLEECFLRGPALRPLLVRVGLRSLPYLDGIAPGLEDALAACGVTLHLDAAGALQVLRCLAELGTISSELATFLYRAIGEEMLQSVDVAVPAAQESECPKVLLALTSEKLVLAPKKGHIEATSSHCMDLEFVNARECIWDGPPLLAAALGLTGPLQALYGGEHVLRSLFDALQIRRSDVALCWEAMNKLATETSYNQRVFSLGNESKLKPFVAVVFRQLEKFLSEDYEAAKKAICCKEWPALCVSGSVWSFAQIGSCSGAPQPTQRRVYLNDDPLFHALFSSVAWFLPDSSSESAPRTPLLELFQKIPFGVFSLKKLVRSHTQLLDELGPQDEYTKAAEKALQRVLPPSDALRLKGVHGCLKAIRRHGLSTTLASREPDVWKAVSCSFDLQKSGGELVIVLAQYVSSEGSLLPEDTAVGRAFSLSSWECRSPHQLREALALALAEAFAPSCPDIKARLEKALSDLMPEPPPLLQHLHRQGDRQPSQQARNEAKPKSTHPDASSSPSWPEEKKPPQVSTTSAQSQSHLEAQHYEEIEDAISNGINLVEAGWRIICEIMHKETLQSDRGNRGQSSTAGLLWDPSSVLHGDQSNHQPVNMSHHREVIIDCSRDRLEPILAEMHALLSPNFRPF